MSYLHRLGRSSAAHPWRVISAWILLVATAAALASSFGAPMRDDWDVPGARAQQGIDLMREHGVGGFASARVVVHDRGGDALPSSEVDALTERLRGLEHVADVAPPRLSADGDTAVLTVQYAEPITHPDLMANIEPLEGAIADTIDAGLQVELGGELPETAGEPIGGTGELVGVGIALLILVIALGSAVGAGLPIGAAVAGLAVGSSGIALLSATMSVSTSAPMVASMVGLGVGIDYALLLLTRTRDHLAAGLPGVEASERAAVTAGRSVVLAGTTVLVSLLGLRLAGLPTYSAFGFATAITVLAVMASTLVLVPALCGLMHRRLLPRRVRRAPADGVRPAGPTRSERWANRVAARPLAWALAAVTVMLVLAAPVLDMRTWPQSGSDDPTSMQA